VGPKQKFRGTLRPDGTSLQWTIVTVPFDPAKTWPRRKGLRVRGTINGFPFRTSLFRSRDGSHFLLVNKKMQKEGGVRPGHLADVVLEPDLEDRPATTPPELDKLLRRDRALRSWYEQLSEYLQRWIGEQVAQPKSAEARTARAEMMAERMMLAMEGERVTPPILEALFQGQPKARQGWHWMTPVQRRGHLLGIFYYQGPESRQKRARQAIESALKVAERRAARGGPVPRNQAGRIGSRTD
jgi:hypothetical protein